MSSDSDNTPSTTPSAAPSPGSSAAGSPKASADHRRAPRRRSEQEIVIELVNGDHVGAPTPVAMQDFSPRGIGFLHTSPLEIGTQFILTLIQNGGASTRLLYHVSRCRKVGGAIFNVGAEFLCVVDDRMQARRTA